jgi:diguanylate cyclase (GGDEF)-like protein
MSPVYNPPVPKKAFVIIARFMLLGIICLMMQMKSASSGYQVIAVVLVFGLTNVFFLFQPASAFERERFSTWIFAFDTFAITLFIWFVSPHAGEIYLAYFLTIFIAAIARSAFAAVATSIVSCAVYALLTLYGRTGVELYSAPFAIRVGFFLITAMFIGYLAEEVRKEREERRVVQSLLRSTSQLAVLFDVSNKMVSTMSLPELYRYIVEGAARALDADAGSLMIKDTEADLLRVEAAVGHEAEALMGYTLRVGERIAGRVAQQGNGVLLQKSMDTSPHLAQYASPRPIRSAICAPLKIGDRVLGVLNMNRIENKEPLQPDDLDLLTIFANHAALVLDRVQLYKRIEELSRTDRLLAIYNRGALDERLQEEFNRAQRYNRPLALIILDVDGFKDYNDHYGHQAGDAVLRSVAEAIKASVRKTDFVGRYGGDEIAVLLPEANLDEAVRTAERAKHVMADLKITFGGKSRAGALTLSAGVATFNASAMSTAADLIKQADAALYRAKKEGRNKVVAL